ncbi:MAG: hypothetical protein WA019_00665, partial [Candidatus Moraniibacteriota bacterium]
VNIGRFAATLSASTAYNWSVPTFTDTNLVNRPIYETRQLALNQVLTSSAGSISSLNYYDESYQIIGSRMFLTSYTAYSLGSATAKTLSLRMPRACGGWATSSGDVYTGNDSKYLGWHSIVDSMSFNMYLDNDGVFPVATGQTIKVNANFRI